MEKQNIQQLIKKNPSYAEGYQNIYPWTYTESVKDKETGELLDETLSRMNYFTLAYGGSEYDTRIQVPLKYRKKGTIISYLDYNNLLHVDFYSKDEIDDMSWVSDENWIPVFSYYNGFFTLPWRGNFKDTLLQINKAYRHWGMMITYNDGNDIPVHLKYLENNTDDAAFTNKDNWEGLDRPAFLEWLRQTVANILGDIHEYPLIMEEFNTWFREELIPVIDSKDATVLNSAKTYTNNQIKALIAGAPETLDTLKEIADLLEKHGEVIETLVTKEAFNTHVNDSSIHLTASDVNTILTNKTDNSVSTTSNNFITNSAITKYVNTSSTNAKNSAVSTAKDSLSSWIVSGTDTITVSTQPEGVGLDVNFGSITSDSTKAVMGKTVYTELSKKQNTLVSGTSIKTINSTSLLGSGNISIPIITVDSAITSGSTNAVQSGAVYTANQNLANTVNTYHTELNDKITDLYAQLNTKQATLVSGTNIKTINGNSILGSGNITIEEGGGSSVTVDDSISSTSENPVQNKVIYNALLNKQDVIDFDNSDVYSSTQPNGVGIHLKSTGVTAKTYGPTTNTTGSSVIIPYIVLDGSGRATDAGNTTFSNINAATATKATQDGSGNVITSTYRTISDSYSIADMNTLFSSNTALGTSIVASENLNTIKYLTAGNYYCGDNKIASSLSNCPAAYTFNMRVLSCTNIYDDLSTNTYVRRVREITDTGGNKYIQYASSNSTAGNFTYGPWKKLVDSEDTLFKLTDSSSSTTHPLVLGNTILLGSTLSTSTQGTGSVGLSINFGSVASGSNKAVTGDAIYTAINDAVATKQDKLTSSTVLATINGNSLTYGGSLTIDGGGSSISVDSSLSTTSTNPVQNKVITTNINSINSNISSINSSISSINTSLDSKTTLTEVQNNINGMVTSGTLTTSTQPEGVGVDLKSGIITAGSYGPTADVTAGSSGASIVVPQITVDTYGRVTNIAHRTLKVDNYVKSITTGSGVINCILANGEVNIVNIPNATTSASGYMSSSDKTKLDGIAAGATAVTVDSSLSSTSTNAIQNKAVYTGLSKKQDTIDFDNSDVYSSTQTNGVGVHIRMDSAMSSTSTKPVQNKVIKAYVDDTISSSVSNINGSNYAIFNTATSIDTVIASSAYVLDIRAAMTPAGTGVAYTISNKKLIFNGGSLPNCDLTFKNCEIICKGQNLSTITGSDGRIMWSDSTFVAGQMLFNATTNKPLYYNGGWYTADGSSYAGNPESSF